MYAAGVDFLSICMFAHKRSYGHRAELRYNMAQRHNAAAALTGEI